MLVPSSLLARGARVRSGAALLVLAAVACDTNAPALDPTAASNNLNGVGLFLDLPTVAVAVGAASSTLHALRPGTHGVDTVAAVWHSSDDAIVSIGADGVLTPHAAGSAAVWARVGHDSVSSAVTVAAGPVASVAAAQVAVRPNVAVLAVGVSQQFTASVQVAVTGTTSTTAVAPVVTWASSAPAVAAVSSNGTVVPIAPGIAVITATTLGVRATSTVVVTSARAAAASRIDIGVTRFDGGSGSVLVSNGIPFARGAVTEATLNQVHLFVNGTEQPIFTRALGGRWPDGSLRAALVQFTYNIPDARTIPGYISIGGARTLATPAERPAAPKPIAAALPTSPEYLISTKLVGTVYDPATTRAATTLVAQYETDFARLAANDWAQCGADAVWSCGRTASYDRSFILYQAWVRTGNPTYWQHASVLIANYIDGYLVPNKGAAMAWWVNSQGMAMHYWATGDERTRGYMHALAATLLWQVRPGSWYELGTVPSQRGDDRDRAQVLMAAMDARMIDAQPTATGNPMGSDVAYYSSFLTSHSLEDAISLVLSSQQSSGGFGGFQYKGGQKNFMTGMLLTALIRYYEEFTPDSRIPSAVQRAVDYMTAHEWVASAQGFKYCTYQVDSDDWDEPEPSLNNLVAPAYAWVYNRTGNAQYATMVDQMMLANANADRTWWAASGKSFDQGFSHIFNVMAWRNR